MHANDAEQLIAVIAQLKMQQEVQLAELNNHLGAIAGQLERIGNSIEHHRKSSHISNITKGNS
jgi:hypothetical protein